MVDLKEKMKANAKQKKKNKKAPGAGGASPLEMNGETVKGGEKVATGQELSGEDEEDEISSTNSPVPPPGNRVENSCQDSKNSQIFGTFLSVTFILKFVSATFEIQRKSSTAIKSKDKPGTYFQTFKTHSAEVVL